MVMIFKAYLIPFSRKKHARGAEIAVESCMASLYVCAALAKGLMVASSTGKEWKTKIPLGRMNSQLQRG